MLTEKAKYQLITGIYSQIGQILPLDVDLQL
jgi:hypothetical protein